MGVASAQGAKRWGVGRARCCKLSVCFRGASEPRRQLVVLFSPGWEAEEVKIEFLLRSSWGKEEEGQ